MNINIYVNLLRHNFQYQFTVQRFQKTKNFYTSMIFLHKLLFIAIDINFFLKIKRFKETIF